MNRYECPREQDVLDALVSRRWPNRCELDLQAHVSCCELCGDLVAVASALLDDGAAVGGAGDVPPAGLVWWRAQLRGREEAARAAARPVRLAQNIAVVLASVLVVMAGVALAPSVRDLAPGLLASVPQFDPEPVLARGLALIPNIDAALAHRAVQLGAASWLILAPVAVYLAFARD